MPSVHRLALGQVALPSSHPRAAEGSCPIVCFAIEHGDGVVVVDTGPRRGHPVIDALYAPEVISIVDALAAASLDERDVTAVVNTHLHFDHCGQNHLLDAPVWVTEAELDAARAPSYTVPEWAEIPAARRRLAADGEEIAHGIRLLHTPGHTPGHLSVSVEADDGTEIVVGQACYSCAEFSAGLAVESDMHDPGWISIGDDSLARLRRLDPVRAHLSHDAGVFERGQD